jgi:glucose/arabinose dehydrogenase
MPTGLTKRFRGLRMHDGALYAAVDEGEIYKITARK